MSHAVDKDQAKYSSGNPQNRHELRFRQVGVFLVS